MRATDASGDIRPVASRSSRTLHLTDRPAGSLTLTSAHVRQQRRRLFPMEPRRYCRLQILEHRSSLLTAGRYHRPDPLAPAVAPLAPRPLRDQAVDHHEPDRLLRQVVRRFHPGGRDEPEIALPMHGEPLRQVAAGPRRRHVLRPQAQDLGPRRLQPALKLRGRELLRDDGSLRRADAGPRSAARRRPAPAGPAAWSRTSRRGSGAPGRTGGPRRIRDDTADRTRNSRSPAPRRTPSPIRRSTRSAPRGVDFEQRVQSGPEAPDPLGLTVLLVPGLIDIEPVLVGQVFEQLRVGLFQRPADLGDDLGATARARWSSRSRRGRTCGRSRTRRGRPP